MAVEHGRGRSLQPFELHSDPERLIDEADLFDNIAFASHRICPLSLRMRLCRSGPYRSTQRAIVE
jgi:hypothetical protein